MCMCSFFILKCPPPELWECTILKYMQQTLLGFDVCISVISFRIEAQNTFICVWYYIWKNKIPLLIFCCLILCQHVHLKVCIITIFHFILLLQFIKCTVQVHHNISKNTIQSLTSYTRPFHFKFPNVEFKEKKEGGASVKVIMGSRFSDMWNKIYWFVLTNIF